MKVIYIESNIQYKYCVRSLILFYLQERIYVLQYTSWKSFSQILVKYTLRVLYICWEILGTTIIWAWNIMPGYRINLFMESWDTIALILRTNWWCSLTPDDRTVHILEEVQDYILCFIKGDQLIIVHIFQVQLLNKLLKWVNYSMHYMNGSKKLQDAK